MKRRERERAREEIKHVDIFYSAGLYTHFVGGDKVPKKLFRRIEDVSEING